MNNQFMQTPVVILCGGKGLILNERQSQRLNKGLIVVANKPLFLWVIHHYALYGATDFILATGFQNEQFGSALEAAGASAEADKPGCFKVTIAKITCNVRIVPTPPAATTAGRLLACKPWLEQAARFAVTYSDTLSNVDLSAEMRLHISEKRVATLVATSSPMRFRILGMRQGETLVRAFAPRPVIEAASINGGYYIFTRELWNDVYGLSAEVALENQPLERLASSGQLAAYTHKGDWQYCDAERDLPILEKLAMQLDLLQTSTVSS